MTTARVTRSNRVLAVKRSRQLEESSSQPSKRHNAGRRSDVQSTSPTGDKENACVKASVVSSFRPKSVHQEPATKPLPVLCRSEEARKLSDTLLTSLAKRQGESVYVPGQPGTGKTHTVRQVLAGLMSSAACAAAPPAVAFINCQDRRASALGPLIVKALYESAARTSGAFLGVLSAHVHPHASWCCLRLWLSSLWCI